MISSGIPILGNQYFPFQQTGLIIQVQCGFTAGVD